MTASAQQNPVVIGGTLGLTGAYAEPSTDYKFVYDRWLEEVNKKGGCAILLQSVNKQGLPGPILGAAVVQPATDPADGR